jgi:hypothetical protein
MKLFFLVFSVACCLPYNIYSQIKSTQNYIDAINNELRINNPGRNSERSYDVELSNGYFYSYGYYQNKKVGESRIHIDDIASIEYTSGMGELYLKLLCNSSKDCSIWTNYGKDTVFDYMMLQVADSRSGDYIKDAINKIVLKETGKDITYQKSNYVQNDSSRKVYFCDSQSAYAYHSTLNCDGLSNCEHQIYSTSENNVRQKGYRYCELCWE